MQKPKYSNFHITVNLNSHDLAHLDVLRETIEDMPKHPWIWVWLKQVVGRGQQIDFDEASSPLVQRVRLRAALENQGEKNEGLHAHIVVEVQHVTRVQVSGSGLGDFFRGHLPAGVKPNIHSRFVKGEGDSKEFILHYLTKEVPNATTAPRRFRRLTKALTDGEPLAAAEEDRY